MPGLPTGPSVSRPVWAQALAARTGRFAMGSVALCAAALAGAGVSQWRTRDLTARLAAAEQAAMTDVLTGLGNRAGLTREFERAVASAAPGSLVVLVLLDLDNLKEVNDGYGHDAGDRLLVAVGRRLGRLRVLHQKVFAARLGGDEFVVLFRADRQTLSRAAVGVVNRDVARCVGAPVAIETTWVCPRASVGTAYADTEDADLPTLLAEADQAMYRAKVAQRPRPAPRMGADGSSDA